MARTGAWVILPLKVPKANCCAGVHSHGASFFKRLFSGRARVESPLMIRRYKLENPRKSTHPSDSEVLAGLVHLL